MNDQLRVRLEDLVISADRRYDQSLDETLVASIRRHGLLQPIVVQPDGAGRYEVLAGRRRLRHAAAAGLAEVPVLVRGTDGALDRLMIEAEENAHRVDWSPMEVADLCRELIADHGWTQLQVAEWLSGLLGRSVLRTQVAQYLKLLEMTDEARVAVAAGTFSFSWGRELSRLNESPDLQRMLVADLLRELASPPRAEEPVSARAIRKRVDRFLTPPEWHGQELREAGAQVTERVHERGMQNESPRSNGAPAARPVPDGVPELPDGEGDPLAALYLDLAHEALTYLVALGEVPDGARAKEVMQLARTLAKLADRL